jgi:hypothetical protein
MGEAQAEIPASWSGCEFAGPRPGNRGGRGKTEDAPPVKTVYREWAKTFALQGRDEYDSLTKLRRNTPHVVAGQRATEAEAPRLKGRERLGCMRSRVRPSVARDTAAEFGRGRGSKPRLNRRWGR